MTSKELEKVLELLRSYPSWKGLSIQEQRALEGELVLPVAEDIHCEPVDAGGVPAEWISAPKAVEEWVLYYLHGGGYTHESISMYREMISRLARAAGVRALAIDYRLAPENPFPAAVEDSLAAYRWLSSSGVDPSKVIIGGDSAGGGLTVATMVALRDAGEPLPAAGVCISPWVDMEGIGKSMITKAEVDPMVTKEVITERAELYLGKADPRTPLAAPIYAELRGLPPLLIQVGTSEVLLDDATRLAERARSAGVYVTLETWEDMFHVWHSYAAMLPEGQQAIERVGEFIRKLIG